MQFDYLISSDGMVHLINVSIDHLSLDAGIACVFPGAETPCRIASGNHRFTIDLPGNLLSRADRIKAFNVSLDLLSYEQVQLSTGD